MINRVLAYLLPTLIILGSASLFASGEYLRAPRGESDNVLIYIEQLKKEIISESWETADNTLNTLEIAFGKVVPRVQYSVDRNDIINFEITLSRLRGAILAKEKGEALIELSETSYHWHTFGKK